MQDASGRISHLQGFRNGYHRPTSGRKRKLLPKARSATRTLFEQSPVAIVGARDYAGVEEALAELRATGVRRLGLRTGRPGRMS